MCLFQKLQKRHNPHKNLQVHQYQKQPSSAQRKNFTISFPTCETDVSKLEEIWWQRFKDSTVIFLIKIFFLEKKAIENSSFIHVTTESFVDCGRRRKRKEFNFAILEYDTLHDLQLRVKFKFTFISLFKNYYTKIKPIIIYFVDLGGV